VGRRREQQPPEEIPEISTRIEDILNREFDGNARSMSAELGVPYLSLLRTLHGSDPSTRLLAALVERADVDAKWLLTGRRVQPEDFGIAGDVSLVPVSSELIPVPSAAELFAGNRPRHPVVSELPLHEAYAFAVPSGLSLVREGQLGVKAGDLLLIKCSAAPDERFEGWNGSWVVFTEPGVPRARLGHLQDRAIRASGEKETRFKVGPDLESPTGRLHGPRKKAATKYGVDVNGIVTLYQDAVVGRVAARIVWRHGFRTTESLQAK
jgi:hypothetical protein